MNVLKSKKGRPIALCVSLALLAGACGSDSESVTTEVENLAEDAVDDTEGVVDDAEDAADDVVDDAEDAADDVADDAEEIVEDPATTEAPEPETDAIVAAFDANGDGTVTIGVAAARRQRLRPVASEFCGGILGRERVRRTDCERQHRPR